MMNDQDSDSLNHYFCYIKNHNHKHLIEIFREMFTNLKGGDPKQNDGPPTEPGELGVVGVVIEQS